MEETNNVETNVNNTSSVTNKINRSKGRNTRRRKNFGKFKFANNRNNGMNKRPTNGNSFKLIDKDYKYKRDIIPGLTVFSEPLYGEITVEINLHYAQFKDVIRMAMYRWIKNSSYGEIRQIRGLLGVSGVTEEDNVIIKFAHVFTFHAFSIIRLMGEMKNISRKFEDYGIYSIRLPKIVYDLLHLVANFNQVHKPAHLENSYFSFNSIINYYPDEEFIKYMGWKEEDSIPTASIDKSISFLERSCTYMQFLKSVEVQSLNQFNTIHPNFMNAMFHYEERNVNKKVNLMVASDSNEVDVCLVILLNCVFENTTLKQEQVRYYNYPVAEERIKGALRNFIINNYTDETDNFQQPSVNEYNEKDFEIRKTENTVIVRGSD